MKVNRVCEIIDYIITKVLMPVFIFLNFIIGCMVMSGKVELTRTASSIAMFVIALAMLVICDMDRQIRNQRRRMS